MNYWDTILKLHNIQISNIKYDGLNNIDFEYINNSDLSKEKPLSLYLGGGKIIYTYKNDKYIFFKTKDNINIIYSIKELNNNELMDCVLIIIEKEAGIAHINNISNYDKCINDKKKINGSEILDVSIDFIKYVKNKYKIKKIRLKDNSYKICKGGNKMELSRFYILLYGDTWYGSRGFRPYTKKVGVNMLAEYDTNLNINKRIKIKDAINLIEYFKRFYIDYKEKYEAQLEKNKIDTKKNVLDNIKFIENNPNMNLGKFLRQMLKDYEKNCVIFSSFYKNLFIDLEYFDFYTDSFELNI